MTTGQPSSCVETIHALCVVRPLSENDNEDDDHGHCKYKRGPTVTAGSFPRTVVCEPSKRQQRTNNLRISYVSYFYMKHLTDLSLFCEGEILVSWY